MTDQAVENAGNPKASPEPACFPELAPMYALNCLSPQERAWVEQQMLDCPDLADDMVQQQMIVAAMAYDAELPIELEPRLPALKNQLFDRLQLDLPAEPSLETPMSGFVPFFAMRSSQLNWLDAPVPKVKIALIYADETTREKVGLLRAEADMVYPRHRHGGTEEIYMLSGDLTLEGIVYHGGDYIRSASGSTHGEAYSREGCMFFFRSSMDDDYS
ncbi:MAG: anti-sigma factor [Alkalinema sp. RU_4_3]|nr:anti-sigma factor [Alkalinema sp. RU_4_3]